jgi:hypothetical protein
MLVLSTHKLPTAVAAGFAGLLSYCQSPAPGARPWRNQRRPDFPASPHRRVWQFGFAGPCWPRRRLQGFGGLRFDEQFSGELSPRRRRPSASMAARNWRPTWICGRFPTNRRKSPLCWFSATQMVSVIDLLQTPAYFGHAQLRATECVLEPAAARRGSPSISHHAFRGRSLAQRVTCRPGMCPCWRCSANAGKRSRMVHRVLFLGSSHGGPRRGESRGIAFD